MPDVDFLCSILALNREIGSRLSPMLGSLRQTLKDRRAVDRKLQALTSESRSAARILTILPFFVIGLQAFLNPRQISFLFSDPTGRSVLAICAICMWLGVMIIRRMSKLMERP
jgi:tight adherence protein B